MRAAVMVGIALSVAAAGCNGLGRRGAGPPTVDRVDRVDLILNSPAVVDWDGRGGPDGVSVRLYLYQIDKGKVRTVVGSGAFEFFLYEGVVGRAAVEGPPFHRWRFTAEQMREHLAADMYRLWCHPLLLQWGDHVPAAANVTLIARYTAPDGGGAYSAPASFAMSPE